MDQFTMIMIAKYLYSLLLIIVMSCSYYYYCEVLYPQNYYNNYFVKHGPRWFHEIPEIHRTASMYEIYMRYNNLDYLNSYDETKITQEMCNRIFKFTNDLQNIPEEYRSPELYEKYMVNNNINKLHTHNNTKITQEMCDRVVELRYSSIQNIPEKYRTFEMCDKLVKFHPKFLMYVPKHIQIPEMCVNAISKDFSMIKFVKIKYDKTIKDIIRKKIIESPLHIEYISKHYNNEDLFWFAFELSNGQTEIMYTSTNFTNRMRHFCLDKINNDLTKLKSYDGCFKILEFMLP